MGKWVKKWKVPGSNDKVWTVSIDKDGNYGCSCPRWIYKREQCHHIDVVKANGGNEIKEREIRPAKVREVTLEDDRILVPLCPIGDTWFQATVVYDLVVRAGVPFGKVKERHYQIARRNSFKRIRAYVEAHGRRIYGPRLEPTYNIFEGYETVPVEAPTAS